MKFSINNFTQGCFSVTAPTVYNLAKQNSQSVVNTNHQFNTEYNKYSIDNLKANYLVQFKGNITRDDVVHSNINGVNHETYFFREPKTDEIVQNYILDNFSDDDEINIVSGACSSGEEAKSYAMMLDSLGDKLQIFGFDISGEVIKQVNNDTVRLLIDSSMPYCAYEASEKFLIENNPKKLTPYQQKCRQKFETYYEIIGTPYQEPVCPDAQRQLNELNEVLNNREKYEKAKKEYYAQIKEVKERVASGEIADEMGVMDLLDGFSFDETNDINKNMLEAQAKMFNTFQDVKLKKDAFGNCHFKQGDIMNLGDLYSPSSVNVLLYRNALYHTLCQGNNSWRIMLDDAPEKMDFIAKQMNQILKQNGLVVFGEDEFTQGIDDEVINISMTKNGFKKNIYNGRELDEIWVKIADID